LEGEHAANRILEAQVRELSGDTLVGTVFQRFKDPITRSTDRPMY